LPRLRAMPSMICGKRAVILRELLKFIEMVPDNWTTS
jgi:hypothetical protein